MAKFFHIECGVSCNEWMSEELKNQIEHLYYYGTFNKAREYFKRVLREHFEIEYRSTNVSYIFHGVCYGKFGIMFIEEEDLEQSLFKDEEL